MTPDPSATRAGSMDIADAAGRDRIAQADLASVARGGMLNLLGVMVNTVFNFVMVVIVTRGLGGTATGLFFEAIAVFNILATASQWGADVGVVRSIPRYRALGRGADVRHSISAALAPVVVAGILFGAALFLLAGPLGRLFTNGTNGDELTQLIRVLAPFLPVSAAYTVALAVTRGFGTMLPSTAIDKLGRAAAQPLLAFIVIAAGASSTALAIAWASPLAFGLVAALIWIAYLAKAVARSRGDSESAVSRSAIFREFWRFTAPRGLASMFAVVILWLDTLLIGALRSPAEAGVYAAATRYLAFGQFIGVAIIQVVGPKLSEVLAVDDRERARSVFATATWWLMALAWPLYLTMIVLAPALLSVFGPGYQQAATVLVILGCAMLIATGVGPVDVVLLMAGKSSWNLFNTIVAVVTNVVLNLMLIPPLGIEGAAIAWGASILVNNLLPLVQVGRVLHLHPFGLAWLIPATCAIACYGVLGLIIRWVLGPRLVALVPLAVLVTPLYLALLWRFRGALHLSAFEWPFRGRRREATPRSISPDSR